VRREVASQKGLSSGGLQLLQQVPDLVIEILSPTNTRRDLDEKIEDFRSIGVRECWIVSPEALTVEVMRLSAEGIQPLAIFGTGRTVRSQALEGLALPVAEIFA
jgi:Uma2 family endonuclease